MRQSENKKLAHQMHDHKYLSVYLTTWIYKYNKIQRKKYLNSVRTVYETQFNRNKKFKHWMNLVIDNVRDQVQEIESDKIYKAKLILKVFKFFQFHNFASKRHQIISNIVEERWTHLRKFTFLQAWVNRREARVQKRILY